LHWRNRNTTSHDSIFADTFNLCVIIRLFQRIIMIYFSTKTGICHPVVEAAGGNLKALYALGTRSLELQSIHNHAECDH
jgi:hypothetical protein